MSLISVIESNEWCGCVRGGSDSKKIGNFKDSKYLAVKYTNDTERAEFLNNLDYFIEDEENKDTFEVYDCEEGDSEGNILLEAISTETMKDILIRFKDEGEVYLTVSHIFSKFVKYFKEKKKVIKDVSDENLMFLTGPLGIKPMFFNFSAVDSLKKIENYKLDREETAESLGGVSEERIEELEISGDITSHYYADMYALNLSVIDIFIKFFDYLQKFIKILDSRKFEVEPIIQKTIKYLKMIKRTESELKRGIWLLKVLNNFSIDYSEATEKKINEGEPNEFEELSMQNHTPNLVQNRNDHSIHDNQENPYGGMNDNTQSDLNAAFNIIKYGNPEGEPNSPERPVFHRIPSEGERIKALKAMKYNFLLKDLAKQYYESI